MNCKDNKKVLLKDSLLKLNKRQLKLFYGILVHYWVKYKFFITTQNFYNLWCELNELCHDVEECFPEPYDDKELLKSYCLANPYYFIDILDSDTVVKSFCEYFSKSMILSWPLQKNKSKPPSTKLKKKLQTFIAVSAKASEKPKRIEPR